MYTLFHDFETFSEADITATGAPKYARHPSTEILMLSFLLVDIDKPLPEEWEVPLLVQQWVPAEGQKMPGDLKDMLRDPEVVKQAWNASFERNIWKHVAGIDIPYDQWRCSMVMPRMRSMLAFLVCSMAATSFSGSSVENWFLPETGRHFMQQ